VLGDLIQPTHLLFILVVALLVLGPKRLPEVAKSLGKGLRDFRGAMSGIEEHTSDLMSSATVHVPTPAPAEPTSTTEVAASVGLEGAPVTMIDPLPVQPADVVEPLEATPPAAPAA
jgi:sec-independent protein translocase protein TatA